MEIYMVNGSHWADYAWKLFFISTIALLVVIYDWKRNGRKDYIWVFIVATVYWAIVEYVMHLTGTRNMPTQQLLGIDLPLEIGVIIQGTSEAAYPGVLSLFIADRLAVEETKNMKEGVIGIWIIIAENLITLAYVGVNIPKVGGAVGSRRNLFDLQSNTFILVMVIFIIIWMVKANPELRRRSLYYYGGLVIFFTCFTIVSVAGGNRWVEVGPESGPWTRAPPLLEVAVQVYFVTVQEMAKCVPFFILPCLFGWIKSSESKSKRN